MSTVLIKNARCVATFDHAAELPSHAAENDHDLAWLGPDVWLAHCVKLDDQGISLFAATRTGVAHCPCSNMRLASGGAQANYTLVNGRVVVRAGHLVTVDLGPLVERHNALARQ